MMKVTNILVTMLIRNQCEKHDVREREGERERRRRARETERERERERERTLNFITQG